MTPCDVTGCYDDTPLSLLGDAECLRNGQPLPTFDAFLLYDDGDADFAAEIIQRMEARGIKVNNSVMSG